MPKKQTPKETQTAYDLSGMANGQERFSVILQDDTGYTFLSVHVIDGARYQVISKLNHPDGVAIEFLRLP